MARCNPSHQIHHARQRVHRIFVCDELHSVNVHHSERIGRQGTFLNTGPYERNLRVDRGPENQHR